MSKTVDERVVSMRFDNQQFERGVRQTSDSLERFKEKFNFRQQETEFDRLQGLVNTFSLTHMASELSSLGDRFGLFGTIAGRALENITDKAMSTVGNLIDQLGIGFGGIKDGFAEYELQINSIQTMLANMGRESESTADTMMSSAGRISSSLQEMATQVVRGDWGNGQDRIEALGKYYQQIQDAVNDAWAAGGKVPEGWERGLETISGSIELAAEDAAESIEGIGDASETAEERNKRNLEKIKHNLGILNEYADKTVYTFSDMTNAIGQFMTAGVDLDTSTTAIQGLSNIAAAFGVDNSRLKNTFYQLSQAINSGKVQLLDWRSVINANMSGPLFRDEIINTAKEMGALADLTNMSEKELKAFKAAAKDAGRPVANLADVEQDFNGSLKEGWFTADILTAAIAKFTESGLAEYFEETTGVAKDYGEELIKAYLETDDATESQEALNKAVEEFTKSGQKGAKEVQNYIERLKDVSDAATKVKSVTQLLQVIREGIGTGWASTFEIVIGDFYEAQDLFTGISNKVNGFINDVANARNKILQEWKEKGGRTTLLEALGKIFDFTDADSIIYNLIKPIKDALLEVFNLEGFNSDNLVNATNKFKAIVENVAKFIKDHYEEIKGIVKLVAVYFRLKFNMFMAKVKLVLFLLKLFSPVLKVIFEVVGRVAGALGNLLNQSSGISGIISGMTDAFNGLGNSLSSISGIKLPDLSGFTDKLGLGSINLSGLGSVGDTISQFVGGIAGAGQNADAAEATIDETQKLLDETRDVAQQASETSDDINSTAKEINNGESLPDAVSNQMDTSDIDTKKIDESTEKIVKSSKKQRKVADTIIDSVKSIKSKLKITNTGNSDSVAGTMTKAVKAMADTVSGFTNKSVKSTIDPAHAQEIVSELKQKKESMEKVGQALADFFYIDKEALKKALNLPEKGGFWTLLQRAYEWLKNNFDSIIEIIRLITTYKLLKSLTEIFSGIADVGAALASMFKKFGKAAEQAAKALKIEALSHLILNFAISIGVLVAAVAGLAAIDPKKLGGAVVALGAIVAIFVALTHVATKIKAMDTGKIAGLALFLITFGASIAILVAAIKSLSKLQPEQIAAGVIGIIALIAGLITAIDHIKMDKAQHINKVAGTILALSVSILLLGAAIKSFAKMDAETFYSGLIRVGLGLLVFTKAIQGIQSSAKENTKSAGTLIALSVALLILGSAIKKFSKMDPETFYRGLVRVGLGLIVLAGAVRLLNNGENTSVFEKGQKIFNPVMRTLLALSAAMLVLSLVLKVIASIPIEKALPAAGILVGIMLTLSTLANLIMTFSADLGEHSGKNIGKTLLSFAGALLVLSIVMKILGSLSIKEAIQGAILITALMGELTVAFAVISQAGKPNIGTIGALITIAIVIAVLSIVIKSLSKLDFANSIGAVAEIGVLLGGLAAVMLAISKSAKTMKIGDIFKAIILLAALTGVVTVITLVVSEFSKITNADNVIPLATAVDMLIGVMAGMLITIAGVNKIRINEVQIGKVVLLLFALAGVVAGVAFAISGFSNMTNPTNAIPLATAVSEILLAMIPVFAAIVGLSKYVNSGMEGKILLLGVVFDLLAGLFTITLAAVIEGIGRFANIEFINKGAEILRAIAKGIGGAIGDFIEAISEGMLHAAENIAKGLEAVFSQITNLVDSLHGKVDDNSVEMVKSVIKLIAVMTAADFIDALTTWFTTKILGGKKSNISDRIKDLGVGIAELQEAMNGVDYYKLKELSGVFDSIANVLVAISSLVLSNTYNDLITFFTGGGNQKDAMTKLTDGLSEFVQNGFIPTIRMLIEEIPDYKTETATKKVEMLGTFADALKPLQQIMPKTTSLVSIIVGQADNNWGKFGESLGDFIKHMTAAVMIITADVAVDGDGNQVTAPNDAKFDKAKTRLETIAQFTNSFREFDTIRGNTPSLKGFIFGEKLDWGDFGRSLSAFVVTMNNAVETLTGDINDENWQNESWPSDTKFDQASKRFGVIGTFTSDFKKYYEIMPQPAEISNMFGTFKFGITWDQFGRDLESFVTCLVNIVNLLATNEDMEESKGFLINLAVERMNKIGQLADPLAKFHAIIMPAVGIINQIHQNLTGQGEWAKFGNDLKQFISSLMTVCQLIGDDKNWTDVDDIDTLLENVEKRSSSLGKLGEALTKFTAFVNTIAFQEGKGSIIRVLNEDGSEFKQYVSAIEQTVKDIPILAQSLVDMAKSIELNKTLIDNLGDENSGTISRINKLKEMAGPIAGFVEAFVNLDKSDSQTAGENLKEVLNAFSEISDDTGKTNLGKFAEGLDEFVNELVIVGQNLVLNEGTVTKSINILKDISEIKFGESFTDLDVFANGAAYLAAALKRIGESLNDENVKRALEEGGFSKLNLFIDSMKSVLNEGVPTFESTGTDLAKALIDGFMDGKSGENGFSIKSQFTEILLDICQRVTKNWEPTYVGMFRDLGRNMVEGFAEGMKNSEAMTKVVNSAKAMADAAKEATEKQLDEHSPSKVMMKVGKFVPLGFAEGIKDRTSLRSVTDASVKMAKTVETATKEYLEIHSPSQVMYKLGVYTIEGFVNGMKDASNGVGEVAKTISDAITAIGKGMPDYTIKFNDEAYIATALAVKGLTVGTVEYEEAVSKAAAANLKFATSLYSVTDEYKSDKEEVAKLTEELQKLREEAEKASNKHSEAVAKAESETAKVAEYMQSKWNKVEEALDGVGETLKDQILGALGTYKIALDIYDSMEEGADKLAYKDVVEENRAAVDHFIDAIDDSTDAGKELKETIKSVTDAYINARSESNSLLKGFNDDVKETEEAVKSSADAVIDKEEELAKKNKEIFDKIVKYWKDYVNKIRDSVKQYTNIFSGVETTIDIFAERAKSAEETRFEESINAWKDYIKKIKDMVKQYIDIFSGTAAGIDLFAEREKPQELQLAEHEAMESRAEAEQELADAERELAEAQARSNAVEGRSLIALNQIEDANNRIAEAKQKIQEIDEKNAEIAQRNAEIDVENAKKQYEQTAEYATEEMIANMEAALKKYEDYATNVKLVEQFDFEGPAKNYIKELIRGGYANSEQIAKIVSASMSGLGEQFIEKFNESYEKKSQYESESYRQSVIYSMEKAREWSEKISNLRSKGLNEDLLNEIVDQGPDNSQLLDMISEDVERDSENAITYWNDLYGDIETTSNSIADTIISTVTGLSGVVEASTESIIDAIARSGNNDLIDIFAKHEESYKETDEYLAETMMSNMGAALKEYRDYLTNVERINKFDFEGPAKDYINELVRGGYSNADQIEKIVRAASSNLGEAFVEQFNKSYLDKSSYESDEYIKSIEGKIQKTQEWAARYAELKDKGLNQNLLDEIAEQGPDNSKLLDMIYADVHKNDAQSEIVINRWNGLYSGIETNADRVANAIAATKSGLAESIGSSAAAIVQAILQTNAGDVPLSVYGEQLRNILASNKDLSTIYGTTYKEYLNKWTEDSGVTRVLYASQKAAEAVNIEINKLNKETNGLFAIQNGLINLGDEVTKAFKIGTEEYTKVTGETNAKTITDTVQETALKVSETAGPIISKVVTPVTDNQALALETWNKEAITTSAIYRREEEVRISVVNAIHEHLRSMRSWLNAINLQVKSKCDSIERAIKAASSAICSAISSIEINVPAASSSDKYTGTPNSKVTITEGTSTNGSTITREYDDTGTLVKETGKVTKVVKGVVPAAKKAGEAVGKAYGEGVTTGTKKSLGIKSPSRVFMEIGKFVDLGFAKGVKDNTPKVAAALSALGNFNPDRQLLDFGIQNGNLLDFGTTRNIARGISPNSAVSVERLMRDFLANQQSTPSNTDNSTTTNNFNITSNNPKEVAYEVDKILQKRTMQRRNAWA